MYNDLIEIISHFESNNARRYWIKALPVCEAIKGYLIVYFDLL